MPFYKSGKYLKNFFALYQLANIVLLASLLFLANGTRINAVDFNTRFVGKKIKKIEYNGLRNTSPGDLQEIAEEAGLKPGVVYSDDTINTATKNIFKNGSFSYLKVDAVFFEDGIKIIFICQELPKVNLVEFRGTEELYDTELRELIPLKEGDILKERTLKKSQQVILDKYQEEGLFLASIRVDRVYDKKENLVDIIFKVDEGEVIKVKKIDIIGMISLDPEKIKDAMEINEDGWFSSGTFSRNKYETDRRKIIDFMRKEGFRDADITSKVADEINFIWQDEKKEERAIHLKITIKEGNKFFFFKYSLAGNKEIDNHLIFDNFFLNSPGEVFDYEKYKMDRQSISMAYASRGHIFARVIPEENLNKEKVTIGSKDFDAGSLVSVNFKIIEGPVARVEEVIIKGNKKTKEHVIRRELLIKPGEIFDSFKIQRSRERVFNLGFFKEVNFDARPGSREPLMNLIIDVQEQPTGTISLGGGYGTQSGFSIFTEVAENNLRGNGQRLSGRFEYGPLRKQIQTTFTDPWIMDTVPISLYVSAYYMLRSYEVSSIAPSSSIQASYDQSIMGGSLGFGYRFWVFWGAGIRFGLQRSTVISATSAATDDIFKLMNLGPQAKRWIGLSLSRDTRDNVFNTVRGLKISQDIEFVGWGGDDHYKRYNPVLEYYFSPFHLPFLKRWPTVMMFRLSGDFTFPPLWLKPSQRSDNYLVESADKLYVGGVEGVRGWDYYDGRFYEMKKQKYWVDGGDHRILYGLEYRIPVEPSILWIVGFIDAGGLWDAYKTSAYNTDIGLGPNLSPQTMAKDNFVYSWGFGLRVQIPVMPIRLYMAQRVIYAGKDDRGQYHGFYGFKKLEGLEFVFGIGDFRY